MLGVYNILIKGVQLSLPIAARFSTKLQLFVSGRKEVFSSLAAFKQNHQHKEVVWIHCASLGEFEQGRPLIEYLNKHTNFMVVLTFFSPSGYEVRKHYEAANLVCYLPLDTPNNATQFVETLDPKYAFFVKYEFWPNYLKTLNNKNIPTYLISGIFRKEQLFFKWYGKWMQAYLHTFEHIFVQNKASKTLLDTLQLKNVSIGGDTRYDRVYEIIQQPAELPFITAFKQNKTCIVYGSTWKEDIDIISETIGKLANVKHLIAPHQVAPEHINALKERFSNLNVVCYSELNENTDLKSAQLFILDTIGILTQVYRYADIAYVGGAFKTGLHNILEPAAYGIPVVIGPEYEKFDEAVQLVDKGGVIAVYNREVYHQVMHDLVFQKDDLRIPLGKKNKAFVTSQLGATQQIVSYLEW